MAPRKSPEKLQEENIELKQLVKEFKTQVRKLQAQNTKLIAKNYAAMALVSAKKNKNPAPKQKPMTEVELARRIAFLINTGAYKFVDGKLIKS